MKTFITADQHFGDDRFKIMQRPFESMKDMHDLITRNYNKVVGDDDLVIFNGDFAYHENFLFYARYLAGKKVLIRGNHDRKFSDQRLKVYFDEIIDEGDGLSLEIEGLPLWVTHYPSQAKPDLFNLIGHIHGNFKVQLNMLNVGVDVHHFRPVPLDDVPFYFKAINEFYDEDAWVAYNDINMQYLGKRGKKGSYLNAKM